MVCYHGTTGKRAQRICAEGFLPRKPSRRVWFAKSHSHALRRARTQARRTHDRPVVLTCDVNLTQLRQKLGKKKVFYRNGVIAVSGPLSNAILLSHGGWVDQPTTAQELAGWVNDLLGLKSYKGVSRRHPGVQRLSRWAVNRLSAQPGRRIRPRELAAMARRWLPEFFEDFRIDPETLRAYRKVERRPLRDTPRPPEDEGEARDDEALQLLESLEPRRRTRGLELLADIDDPDLFDWCAMFLNDPSVAVRVAALHLMRRCEEGGTEILEPLAAAENKRVRGAAIVALAKSAGRDAPRWFARGLKDPEPCVRLETAALLSELDPAEHRAVFELALADPNPDVARRARRLTEGKGYPKLG